MDSIERTIQVTWQHRVLFTDHVFDPANSTLCDTLIHSRSPQPARVIVLLDEALVAARPPLLQAVSAYFAAFPECLHLLGPPIIQEGGEQAKNSWSRVSELHRAIDQYHLDRHSYVVAAGGGALLDVAGFAAATAHRGVRLIRLPTTTLSQCDSGVGVKNGINAHGKKNFIGTFALPSAVINDFPLL